MSFRFGSVFASGNLRAQKAVSSLSCALFVTVKTVWDVGAPKGSPHGRKVIKMTCITHHRRPRYACGAYGPRTPLRTPAYGRVRPPGAHSSTFVG